MATIKVVPIRDLEAFRDNNKFFVSPKASGMYFRTIEDCPEIMKEARKLASEVEEICIAMVEDNGSQYTIGEYIIPGGTAKFVLLNAEETNQWHAEAKTVIYDHARKLTYSSWIRYASGKEA